MAKAAAPKKPLTKTELLANIAAATDVPKKQVAAVLEALANEIKKSLGAKGAGDIRPQRISRMASTSLDSHSLG